MDNNDGVVEYVLLVEQGTDPDRPNSPCPISRLPNGKRALFKREHWPMLKVGESWAVYIDQESEKWAMVHPVRKISSNLNKNLPADVEDTLMCLAGEELAKLEAREAMLMEEIKPLTEQYEHLEGELKKMRDQMEPANKELVHIQLKIKDINRALQALEE